FFQAEDGIRDFHVTGVQTCALPICETKNSGLVEVFNGKLLTEPKQYDYVPMYVHDKGAADSKNAFGFHSFLEKLIGWELPQVQRSEERRVGKECRSRS